MSIGPGVLDNLHVDGAVVDKYVVALFDILRYVGIADVDDVLRRIHLGASEDFHHVTGLVVYRLLHCRGAYLRALGVDKDTDVRRHGARVPYYSFDTFRSGVGGVHSHYVHSGKEQLAYKVGVTAHIADGTYYLRLLHNASYVFMLCKDTVLFPKQKDF